MNYITIIYKFLIYKKKKDNIKKYIKYLKDAIYIYRIFTSIKSIFNIIRKYRIENLMNEKFSFLTLIHRQHFFNNI